MSPVVWVAALFLVGIGVMILEVFVPSGGVLAFVSLAAIIAAIATAVLELGPGAGTGMIAPLCATQFSCSLCAAGSL